ncbi:MAG: hypothetical protein U0Z44_06200 [Kouleothrix sp.]
MPTITVALVPFWAVWPFETLLISRRPAGRAARPTWRRTRRAGRHPQTLDDALR